MMIRNLLVLLLALMNPCVSFSQTATVYGNVRNEVNQPLQSVSIKISAGGGVKFTDAAGDYEVTIAADKDVTISFSSVGYENYERKVNLKWDSAFRYMLF